MSRLNRRNRSDIEYKKGKLSPTDFFDNTIKEIYRISDSEYDYIAKFASDELLDSMVSYDLKISDKKFILKEIDNLLVKFKESC